MIVKAVGITVEEVLPGGDGASTTRGAASEWLVVTSDSRLQSELAAAIRRRGGVVRDRAAVDEWRRVPPAGRRYAFVDLATADDGVAGGFVAQLARAEVTPRPQLIVRGADGDAAGELLARRAGAIAYLAGDMRPGFLDSLIGEISP
jgi:ActR/RegA family two-component response regulator